jgi:hypothetical protein
MVATSAAVCQLCGVREAGMPRIESKPSGVEGHPREEAYLSKIDVARA